MKNKCLIALLLVSQIIGWGCRGHNGSTSAADSPKAATPAVATSDAATKPLATPPFVFVDTIVIKVDTTWRLHVLDTVIKTGPDQDVDPLALQNTLHRYLLKCFRNLHKLPTHIIVDYPGGIKPHDLKAAIDEWINQAQLRVGTQLSNKQDGVFAKYPILAQKNFDR